MSAQLAIKLDTPYNSGSRIWRPPPLGLHADKGTSSLPPMFCLSLFRNIWFPDQKTTHMSRRLPPVKWPRRHSTEPCNGGKHAPWSFRVPAHSGLRGHLSARFTHHPGCRGKQTGPASGTVQLQDWARQPENGQHGVRLPISLGHQEKALETRELARMNISQLIEIANKDGGLSRIRKIREYDANFKIEDFPEKAKDIFIEAHLCLKDMVWDLQYKIVRWSFVESLEPAQVVQVHCSSKVNQGNICEVTIRMHTRQTLAICDRFGRLMYGQEDVLKDVLEYVVFEKHLTNPYGRWRMHGKIIPPWAPPKQPILKTVMIPGSQLKPGGDYEEPQGEAISLS
ncbi:LOW QUALITY PROTEIN: large ribosomal subunit protein mL45-like [Molossus nigricans]